MVVKWQFNDPATLETHTFEINPNEGGSPEYTKNIQYRNTSAPDGKTLLFEGRDNPQTLEFSGVLLTESQYNMFRDWWDKRYQVYVTDDLGREFSIVIEAFIPKRERAFHHPWKHSYTVRATIVDWL